jgi:hypothetical protein
MLPVTIRIFFGPAPGKLIPMDENLWGAEEKVTRSENKKLTKSFSEPEIREA